MKIKKVTKNGHTRYRVNEECGAAGKRQRKFFHTLEAAKAYAAERKSDREQFGTLLPTLILSLLAGLRPEEAQRMQWEDFLPDHIEVKASKAKTRRRRLVPITPQLRAWLDLSKEASGELPVVNFAKKFNRVRQLAGVYEGWPHDALRHSFASYHLAAYRNENETANVMGNSPQMIYGHYREVVPQKDGEAFFGLMPEDCSAEVVSALTTRTELQSKQGRGTKGKPLLGLDTLTEIFQRNGGQPMSKKQLFAALKAQGVSDSTAYHALSTKGHLSQFLRVSSENIFSLTNKL